MSERISNNNSGEKKTDITGHRNNFVPRLQSKQIAAKHASNTCYNKIPGRAFQFQQIGTGTCKLKPRISKKPRLHPREMSN